MWWERDGRAHQRVEEGGGGSYSSLGDSVYTLLFVGVTCGRSRCCRVGIKFIKRANAF
jgi:hypothetical protein